MTVAAKFRKKPVVIEVVQWDGTVEGATPIIDWILDNGGTARYHESEPPSLHSAWCRCDGLGIVPNPNGYPALICPETKPTGPGVTAYLAIDTLEGVMRASAGDWIIKGVRGEFYPCKPEIFGTTYEAVES